MTNQELRQARSVIVTVLVAAFLLFLMAQSRAGEVYEYGVDEQGWTYHSLNTQPSNYMWEQQDIPVFLNTGNLAPAQLTEQEYTTQYAAWSWSQRTGKNFYYAGTTQAYDAVDSIVINWWLPDNMTSVGRMIASYYTATGYRRHATILMNTDLLTWPDANCKHQALLHEVGHAVGIPTHSGDQQDIMYTYVPSPGLPFQDCRYTLTTADVELTQYEGGDRCFVELTPDLDMFVPEIGGQQASLNYDGSGWDLGIYSASAGDPCDTVTVDATGDIYMNDVRSMDMTLTDVELQAAGQNRWTLRFAQ